VGCFEQFHNSLFFYFFKKILRGIRRVRS